MFACALTLQNRSPPLSVSSHLHPTTPLYHGLNMSTPTALPVSRAQNESRATYADTKQGLHLCDEQIANLRQEIQQLCQQEHARRQDGQEPSLSISHEIHALQEQISSLEKIKRDLARVTENQVAALYGPVKRYNHTARCIVG